MYTSLDRIDIVATRPDSGQEFYVQSDHRTAAQIELEPELAVLMAVARVIGPRRMSPETPVVYSCRFQPPAFFRRAVEAAGGILSVAQTPELPDAPGAADTNAVVRLAGEAFAGLAARTAEAHGVGVDLDGVVSVEYDLSSVVTDAERDESGYWSAVLGLGALAGEVIRAANGGGWVLADSGTLPFALTTGFRGGSATVNPLGKAIKYFANGDGDSVAALAEMVMQQP